MRPSMRLKWILLSAVLVGLAPAGGTLHADEPQLLHSLEGQWRFEVGDNARWSDPDFDDSRWTSIKVPSAWEDQGFPGYDGYGWYRIRFTVPQDWMGQALFLFLGHIDDVDETYVNGHFVGFSGSFPPGYITAYDVPREYYLPGEYLIPGKENVLAVRVYDSEMTGGIVRAGYQKHIGIYGDPTMIVPEVSLRGEWSFMPGDREEWAEPGYDDHAWHPVFVPAYWETQGFRGLDGFGWYRTRFKISPALAGKTLVLLLGKIDDADQTFLNGHLIGKTGAMPPGQFHMGSDDYERLRAYTIPSSWLSESGDNLLAVRVFDGFLHGGIYSVPVGVTTREHYLAWRRGRPEGTRTSWLVEVIRALFGH